MRRDKPRPGSNGRINTTTVLWRLIFYLLLFALALSFIFVVASRIGLYGDLPVEQINSLRSLSGYSTIVFFGALMTLGLYHRSRQLSDSNSKGLPILKNLAEGIWLILFIAFMSIGLSLLMNYLSIWLGNH